jgi:hypothetical protein
MPSFIWYHEPPITGNDRNSDKNRITSGEPTQLDPLGVDAWHRNKYEDEIEPDRDWPRHPFGSMGNPWSGCMESGLPISCSMLSERLQNQGVSMPFGGRATDIHAPRRSGLGGGFIYTSHLRRPNFGEGKVSVGESFYMPTDRIYGHARLQKGGQTPKRKPAIASLDYTKIQTIGSRISHIIVLQHSLLVT